MHWHVSVRIVLEIKKEKSLVKLNSPVLTKRRVITTEIMDDTRVVVCLLCKAFAAMVCDLDETVDKTCVLRSPLTTFDWSCLLVTYLLSSDDVKLTVDLLVDSMPYVSYTCMANTSIKLIANERTASSISVQLTASRYFVSSAKYEFAFVTSVNFLNCTIPQGMCKTVV